MAVFVIVQLLLFPLLMATFSQAVAFPKYPGGAVSVAVQVVPGANAVIVNTAGLPSPAGALNGLTFPLVQLTKMVTTITLLSGSKSLWTVSVACVGVLIIVQLDVPACTTATF